MKSMIAVLLCVFFVDVAVSTTSEKYSQVRIYAINAADFKRISDAGLYIDHANTKQGKYSDTWLSETEIELLTKSGVPFEILVDDWDTYYNSLPKMTQPEREDAIRKSANESNVSHSIYGTMGGYLKYTEVVAKLDSMRLEYPDFISQKFSIGTTYEGRTMWAVRITKGPDAPTGRPEVLYHALIHAREPESMETQMYYFYWLFENYGTNSLATYILNDREIYWIPVYNVDGYVYNQTTNPTGGGMWRANRHNNGSDCGYVDPNRNYGIYQFWNSTNGGSSTDPCRGGSGTYRGTGPFSELETQAVKSFVESRNFNVSFGAHTYGNYLIKPWAWSDPAVTPDDNKFNQYLADLKASNPIYTTGTPTQTVGYAVRGGSDDWYYNDSSHVGHHIIAITPETGTSFWPAQSEIIPLAQGMLFNNRYMSLIGGSYVNPLSTKFNQPTYTAGQSGTYKVVFRNKGVLAASNVTVTWTSTNSSISIPTTQFTYPSLASFATDSSVFNFTVSASVANNSAIPTLLTVKVDTTTLFSTSAYVLVGSGAVVLNDIGNAFTSWTTNGTWAVTTTQSNSAPSSFTDSPAGSYGNNANNSMTLVSPIRADSTPALILSFYHKYATEAGYDYCTVEVSGDNGTTWQPVASYDGTLSTWTQQTFDISTYANGSPQTKIRFRLTSDVSVTADGWYVDDVRINGYSLSQPPDTVIGSLSITSPNGGEQWATGSVHNITWTSAFVDSVKIELSPDNASTWSTIVSSISAAGSYSWTLPSLPASQCRVRISDVSTPLVADTSDNPFTMTGLVAYYPFNGNANDESGNGHDGTVFGSTLTTDRFRNANNAYSFDGVSSDIVVPGGGSLDVGGGQTFSIWFRLHTLGESPLVEYFWNGSYFAEHIWANAVWGTGANLVDNNSGNHIISTSNPTVFEWHHLVLTYDNTLGTSSLYLDGSLRSQIVFGGFSPNTSLDLHFGSRFSPHVVLDGDLDDIRIYNSALSATEIDSLYHEGGYLTNQYPFLTSWNMFSVPLTVSDARKTVLFPTANSSAFAYTPGGYVACDTLRNGTGYWLKFSSAQDVGISGTLRTRDTIVVGEGWNMIGTISDSVHVTRIQQIPPTIIASQFYWYNGGYAADTVLFPSRGYWVKTTTSGLFVLSSASSLGKGMILPLYAAGKAVTIMVSDVLNSRQTLCVSSEPFGKKDLEYFELPPLPPAGIFDARFSTNRMLEAVKEGESKTIPIQISYAQYPLTISWDMKDQSVTATLVVGNREVPMTGTGSTTITDPEALISLKLGGQSPLPKEFALAQNFPNPFNPTTTIKYDLPKDSRVSLKLFNMLGQEVATLVNEDQKGGYKSVEWNARLTGGQASSVASGVYFYRLQAGDFVASKKFLLLK